MIELRGVSKSYKDIELFRDLSLTFPSGKIICIQGINGSGKSVLLKLLVGYSKPDSGEILIDQKKLGVDYDFIPDAGVSINAPEFIKNMTGIDNLQYLASIRKVAEKKDILELAEALDLSGSLNKRYGTYSIGMRQKMRLIQALMDKPQILILDEPFDGLDEISRETVKKLLEEFMNADRTIIFTSHNLDDWKGFANLRYRVENSSLDLVDGGEI